MSGVIAYTANYYLILCSICMYLIFNNTSHINIRLESLPYALNYFNLYVWQRNVLIEFSIYELELLLISSVSFDVQDTLWTINDG